jgi:uncharacterized protein YjiS (DUF1127 family)
MMKGHPMQILSAPGSSAAFPHPLRMVQRLRLAITLRKERRALAALDDHLLADIGLTREVALAEAAMPLWDAPGHWIR